MKKSLVFVFLTIFLLTLMGCGKTNTQTKTNDSNNEQSTNANANINSNSNNDNEFYRNISIAVDNKDEIIICKEIFSEYLNYFKNTKDNTQKLIDYKIENVEVKSHKDNYTEFYCTYSIKPQDKDYWLVANGKEDADGWIVNKSNFITIIQKDNKVYIDKLSTSPSLK